jgi:uroporphyrinogen decarboxylase
MAELTGIERIGRFLRREKADRIGVYESFWQDTKQAFVDSGHVKENESLADHFDLDIRECWAFNNVADLDFRGEILEETEDTYLAKDGNGAILRRHKKHSTTPENVDYTVKERKQWEEIREKLANIDERRINFDAYRQAKAAAKAKDKFFVWSGVNVFELMHPLVGHENMLMGMALDPDWIKDMADVYIEMTLNLQEILFAKEGPPDGIWYYEDMGFKQRPFMSPAMYRELIFPSHKRSIEFAHQRGLPVIMHSCGFVEPLLPGMVEAGIDCFQTIEVKAGMDLLRIYKNYGDVLSLMGGMDVRALYNNDKNEIDRELEAKIPAVKEGFGYCLFSDHSIPSNVTYETYRHFIEKGLELGRY